MTTPAEWDALAAAVKAAGVPVSIAGLAAVSTPGFTGESVPSPQAVADMDFKEFLHMPEDELQRVLRADCATEVAREDASLKRQRDRQGKAAADRAARAEADLQAYLDSTALGRENS